MSDQVLLESVDLVFDTEHRYGSLDQRQDPTWRGTERRTRALLENQRKTEGRHDRKRGGALDGPDREPERGQ